MLDNIRSIFIRLRNSISLFSNKFVDDSSMSNTSDKSQKQPHPQIQTDWKSNKNRLTDDLRSQIVKECCDELISPAELASRHGVNVVQIRKIVKDAGKKLPTKYKITSSKNIRYT